MDRELTCLRRRLLDPATVMAQRADDARLLGRVRAGDRDAWIVWFEIYGCYCEATRA